MKDTIIEILSKEKRVSYEITQIARNIDDNYTSEDLNEIKKVLDELIIDGKVYLTNKNKYTLIENTPYKIGRIDIKENNNFGFIILDGEDLYINKKNLNNSVNGDVVLAEIISKPGEKKEGKVIKVLKRKLEDLIGEISIVDNKPIVTLDNKNLNYKLILVRYPDNLVDGLKVSIKLEKEIKNKVYEVSILQVIGHKNAPGTDIKLIEHEKGIPTEFPEEVLEEIKLIPGSISEELLTSELKVRRDLRKEEIFTIDGDDTKDIDDAISVKVLDNNNYKLGVHIADVSYYVKEDSAIREEAFKRGNSYYLADRVTPMLPVELSNGICSLNPNVDRLAMSCEMEIDYKNGKIINYEVFKSIIKSKKQMTYKNVNKIFNNEQVTGYEEFKDTLFIMKDLANLLRKEKVSRGYIDFDREEIKLIVDENGLVTDVSKRDRGIGENLIEDFMIAANESVATYINNMDLPFVYRVHDKPSPEKLQEFMKFISILGYSVNKNINYETVTPKEIQYITNDLKDEEMYSVIADNLLRSMSKAIYSPDNIGHFGLASKIYTHFTSPIRRYSDLTVHTLLNDYVFSGNLNKNLVNDYEKTLPFICEHISDTERNADEAEREVTKMKVAEYMEKHVGDEYEAIINGVMDKGFFVETKELISGLVSVNTLDGFYTYDEDRMALINNKGKMYRLGDKVKVVCLRASKEQRQIDFAVIEGEDNGNLK